ncbi:YceI family protein [Wenyingzhuangia aestuarii]|uniref:YceI family protein n=1 Tax=Wenyingzhuangia aestuarii TaxID=1647582 RepID=UPI00143AA7C5|nr:YceI family protein [Wenyingzhuangia aestuarii]NJB82609.1 polyisoprenoid-binding protein YceI [Wenyingzhuangia aestuarii]
MKKIVLILLAVVSLTACKQKEKKGTETTSTPTYQLDAETVVVNWVGYKFTNKAGVKGQFQTTNVTNNQKGATLNEALTGVEFSIPVSSIFSNNGVRDAKLKSLFFGIMDNTELLSGKVTSVTGTNGIVSLTMNNETHDLPFTLNVQNNTAYLKATIDINEWHAENALASLHKACELLHTGEDGVSKTWNTVDIDAVLNFIK